MKEHFRSIHLCYKFCFITTTDATSESNEAGLRNINLKLGSDDSWQLLSASASEFVKVAQYLENPNSLRLSLNFNRFLNNLSSCLRMFFNKTDGKRNLIPSFTFESFFKKLTRMER